MRNRVVGLCAALTGIAVVVGFAPAVEAQHFHGHHHHHHGWHVAPFHHYPIHTYGDVYKTPPVVMDGNAPFEADVPESPVATPFGSFSHVDDLAAELETLANQLCLDMHYNYSHNAGFKETYRETYAMLGAIKFIHAKEHQGNREAIVQNVQQLDDLLHHVQGDIQEWSRHQRRQVSRGGMNTKLDSIESLLHHLMHDVGVEPQHDENGQPAELPANGEAAPMPGDVDQPSPGFDPQTSPEPTTGFEAPNVIGEQESIPVEDGGPAFEEDATPDSPPAN